MANFDTSFEGIIKDIKARNFAPIYCLMGEEPYYIDLIADELENKVLSEEEKAFNLTLLYGADVDAATIINAAKRYPMMSELQLVIVKEAQQLKDLDQLAYYAQKPLHSTILVLCYKHGRLDKRKKFSSLVDKVGVIFDSKPVKERDLVGVIDAFARRRQLTIEPKAVHMLAEFIGPDLSRLASELDKLKLIQKGNTRITPEIIEHNIGISKAFNTFELRAALVSKDVFKANQIANYFAENPKTNPLPMTLGLLFNYFSNLMLAYYAPNKSEKGIAEMLSLKFPWQAKEYMQGVTAFSGVKTMEIIGAIRDVDARSKGFGNSSASEGELLQELIYTILH